MKIEKTWSANSKSEDYVKGEELINMAGRWNVGIKVSITKPYTYFHGQVERIITEEIHDREIQP